MQPQFHAAGAESRPIIAFRPRDYKVFFTLQHVRIEVIN
jgi:hypothetical protein